MPQLAPLVTDPTGKQLIALIQSQSDIVRFTAGPPGIAGERLEVLRTAYRKALEDKELQAKAEKLERPVDPAYGEDVLKAVQEALNQTPQTVAVLKEAMTTPKEGASAAAAAKGTIAELTDGARKLVLKLDDGKTFEAELSGSRTEITVAGQKADRNSLKAGMACTVDAPGGGAEAKAVSCN